MVWRKNRHTTRICFIYRFWETDVWIYILIGSQSMVLNDIAQKFWKIMGFQKMINSHDVQLVNCFCGSQAGRALKILCILTLHAVFCKCLLLICFNYWTIAFFNDEKIRRDVENINRQIANRFYECRFLVLYVGQFCRLSKVSLKDEL